jgi:hypothetical protein
MRIDANGRISGPREPSSGSRSVGASSGFSLSLGESPGESAGTRATPMLAGLDAMLALQSVDDALSKRRRALRRGRALLDDLEKLKLSLLEGRVGAADKARLAGLVADQRDGVDDPVLDSILGEIDVRAAVELAKLERRATK